MATKECMLTESEQCLYYCAGGQIWVKKRSEVVDGTIGVLTN